MNWWVIWGAGGLGMLKIFSYKCMAIASSFTPFPFTKGFDRHTLLWDKEGKPALMEFSTGSEEVGAIILLPCYTGDTEATGS